MKVLFKRSPSFEFKNLIGNRPLFIDLNSILNSYCRLPFYPVQCRFDGTDSDFKNYFENASQLFNLLNVTCEFNYLICLLYRDGKITSEDIKGITNTSAFRCKEVNSSVGGSPTSLHLFGLALDVIFSSPEVCKIFKDYVVNIEKKRKIFFPGTLYIYELIEYEPTRVHIGYKYYLPKN